MTSSLRRRIEPVVGMPGRHLAGRIRGTGAGRRTHVTGNIKPTDLDTIRKCGSTLTVTAAMAGVIADPQLGHDTTDAAFLVLCFRHVFGGLDCLAGSGAGQHGVVA